MPNQEIGSSGEVKWLQLISKQIIQLTGTLAHASGGGGGGAFVTLAGNDSVTGVKSFSGASGSAQIAMTTTNGSGSLSPFYINNLGKGYGIYVENANTGACAVLDPSGGGIGLFVRPSFTSIGISVQNTGSGTAVQANATGGGTGYNFVGQNNQTTTFSVDAPGAVTATQYKLSALNTAPASATAAGVLGEIRIVNGFIYVCVATNTWQRAALVTF